MTYWLWLCSLTCHTHCQLASAGYSEQDSDTEIKLPFVKSPNPVMALVCELFSLQILYALLISLMISPVRDI